ncbi:hypothetical protein DMUE_3518 [Dictyocoela muelleri]|nr:hypothetical protein DMUE_3518 [Dictyocoela muelleri]
MKRDTYYHYKKMFQSACLRDFLKNDRKIGGVDCEVQIDESLFSKRKYFKGRYKRPLWVFGGVEVGTGMCFFREVENRSVDTLLPIIDLYIEKKTEIVSDMWRSYIKVPTR